ncbi:MAG: aminodeoxychorismate synthase component I [Vicingus serpentipes]|nr:aminodeoxychorismate synthase component I [Vicingus serpentipes]
MEVFDYMISDKTLFEQQILSYYQSKKNVVFLNSNSNEKSNWLAVSDDDEKYENQWQFGFISYDYKNQIEELSSNHFDGVKFPEQHFFTPQLLIEILPQKVIFNYNAELYHIEDIKSQIKAIEKIELKNVHHQKVSVKPRLNKEKYLQNVAQLQHHIQIGDIYEVNYCQEFYEENVQINPLEIYLKLNQKSPTPFSCFVKHNDKYLLSASPERFIQKAGRKIISQPIKGTIKRGNTEKEDRDLVKQLYNDKKERNENIMIVDLVRNDISKIVKKNTVNVDELCAVYTYPQVHQMVSTVSAELKNDISFKEVIHATFPMGSMTGAPKIRAMELIEQYETNKRGLYSGTVGYINPGGDFDFNVVIRSILYNASDNYLSFTVGGAITNQSIPEKEYEECMLKAKAIFEVLSE